VSAIDATTFRDDKVLNCKSASEGDEQRRRPLQSRAVAAPARII
jgi:hypothetical protein